ncbi:MAG: hypothetical protein HY673_05490 [Chloroflexi bacterium]|nr:hypothetical protein [Chloroflexota bacterium]
MGEILQSSTIAGRFAIVDTDAHHGDGTWQVFENDPHVLYLCFCSCGSFERGNEVNVRVPWPVTDEAYLRLVENHLARVSSFQPDLIFWNWGYDGTRGDYGDIGLSPGVHVQLARLLKQTAGAVCRGRLIVVLCGGSRRDLAASLIPGIIEVLATA